MKVFIIKGIEEGKDDTPNVIIARNGVRKTLEGAKKELKAIYDEIVDNCNEEDIEIVDGKVTENGFYICTDDDSYCEYRIVECELLD